MKRTALSLSPVMLAVILSLSLGCATKPNDAKVSSEVQGKFSQDSGLSGKQLTVQASNGVVTLAGTVDNDAQREAAAKQAASVPGVKEVINNLEVGSTAASVAPPQREAQQSSTPPAEDARPAPSRKPRKSHDRHEAVTSNAVDTSAPYATTAGNSPPPIKMPEVTQPAPPPPPPAPKKFVVDQGTQLTIRLVDAIDSEKNQTGETFHATLNAPITSNGEEVLPAGTDVTGHLVDVKSAGKFAGQSQVVLQLDSITAGGRTYNVQTDQYKKTGSSRGKNTAEKVGGGAALGAIIGAIAGGGKGAAIGAAAGGGIGGGVQAATKGQQIKLPSETVLNFTLQGPITVVQSPNPNANRPKPGDSQ